MSKFSISYCEHSCALSRLQGTWHVDEVVNADWHSSTKYFKSPETMEKNPDLQQSKQRLDMWLVTIRQRIEVIMRISVMEITYPCLRLKVAATSSWMRLYRCFSTNVLSPGILRGTLHVCRCFLTISCRNFKGESRQAGGNHNILSRSCCFCVKSLSSNTLQWNGDNNFFLPHCCE